MYVKDEYGYKKRVAKKTRRPFPVSYICIALAGYGFWDLITSYIGVYQGFGTLYPAVNALMIVFSFVAISGVWSMEKWGSVSFMIVIVAKVLVDSIWGHFNPFILLALIPGIYFLMLIPKMRKTD